MYPEQYDVIESYLNSFQVKDWDLLETLLHPDFTYFTDGCIVQDRKTFIKFMTGDVWKSDSFQINNFKVVNQNENLAVVSYQSAFIGSDKGKKMSISAVETTILVNKNDRWQLIHSHTSNKM